MNTDNDKEIKASELPTSISNSNVVISLHSTTVSQDLNQGPHTAQSFPVIHHFFTHEAIGVSHLLRQARQRIVLHAAFYPKYGSNDNAGVNLRRAMEDNHELQLTVIFTDIDHVVWAEEFAHVLRPRIPFHDFKKELEKSKGYFINNLDADVSRRVHIYDSARLPMFPVILIDDILIVGHYAHSSELAPDGLWLTIQHSSIPEMYQKLLKGEDPACKTAEERAILRYVEELVPPDSDPI